MRCYTLNTKTNGRPKGYKPSARSLHNLVNAFKNTEFLKKTKKLYKDNNIQWTFDALRPSAESEKRTERLAELQSQLPNQERRPNADRIDNADTGGEYYANTAFHMAQITAPAGDTLLDRWIVDPGSNVHICNLTYFNWVKTLEAKPTDIIFAGTAAH